ARQAEQMLEDLLPWLDTFFLRFPDGADVLRECWMHHPEVVEVLLALKAAHRDAMRGRGWGTQAMTWLWVYRTQTVEGIRNFMGACDLSRHETPAQPVKAVGASAIEHIAEQWVSTRSTPAPRSEEHTSELQSRENLVCRLLLEVHCALCYLLSFPTRRSSDLHPGDDLVVGVPHADG